MACSSAQSSNTACRLPEAVTKFSSSSNCGLWTVAVDSCGLWTVAETTCGQLLSTSGFGFYIKRNICGVDLPLHTASKGGWASVGSSHQVSINLHRFHVFDFFSSSLCRLYCSPLSSFTIWASRLSGSEVPRTWFVKGTSHGVYAYCHMVAFCAQRGDSEQSYSLRSVMFANIFRRVFKPLRLYIDGGVCSRCSRLFSHGCHYGFVATFA